MAARIKTILYDVAAKLLLLWCDLESSSSSDECDAGQLILFYSCVK